jgi:HD-GYP domain-containing protein (c-di-GMP phosphodiesterase class II)
MVYQHHETPGGTGLPNRLKRSSLHEPSLLIAVVDAWSALISRHPHREAFTPAQAIQKLSSPQLAPLFDPQAVEWLKTALFPPKPGMRPKSF